MREIKFRAWDPIKKYMLYVANFDFSEEYVCVENEVDYQCADINEYEIMQYTGLQDVNGKDIYEGDLIKIRNSFENDMFIIKYHKKTDIGMNGGEYSENFINGFVPTKLDNTVDGEGKCEFAYNRFVRELVVVIGNIHENPELIE